jgi:hypothetical protein
MPGKNLGAMNTAVNNIDGNPCLHGVDILLRGTMLSKKENLANRWHIMHASYCHY